MITTTPSQKKPGEYRIGRYSRGNNSRRLRDIHGVQDRKRSQIIKASRRIWKAIDLDQFHQLPRKLITRKGLLWKLEPGMNAFHKAAYAYCLEDIPEKFRNQKNLRTWSRVFGGNVFHVAADWFGFRGVPRHLRTAENMLLPDSKNLTTLYLLARTPYLGLVPKRLFAISNLLVADDDGDTVLHWAAMQCNLGLIPWQFHTEALFSVPNKSGDNVLHCAARSGGMSQIKERTSVMTPESLLARNNRGETPLGLAVQFDALLEIPTSDALAQRYREVFEIVVAAVRKTYPEDEPDDERNRRLDARGWLGELNKRALTAPLVMKNLKN